MKKSEVLFWSITIALGGFLFGFDTAVISGAEIAIQILWDLSPVAHGFTVSIALIGTVIGAMLSGIPMDRYGPKKVLTYIAILYLVSALGSALAIDWYSFILFRFLDGLGVGASSVAALMHFHPPIIADYFGGGITFTFFAIMMVLQLLFVWRMMPETKGTSLEGVEKNMVLH